MSIAAVYPHIIVADDGTGGLVTRVTRYRNISPPSTTITDGPRKNSACGYSSRSSPRRGFCSVDFLL